MAGFRNVKGITDAYEAGLFRTCSFRKVPADTSVAGTWYDLSRSAGNPPPNYYATSPLVAAALDPMRGIFHGDSVSPGALFLQELHVVTGTAGLVGQYKLLDYLLYYPFIDLDDTDVQTMDNSLSLSRYEDGAGVRAMLVALTPTVGGGSFTFDYINQDGVQKTAPTQSCSVAAANIGTLVTSEQATAAGGQVFLKLASGDSGMRSIVSWQMAVPNGGLGALVLVRPIADIAIREVNTPAEVDFVRTHPNLPRIYDSAYLNLIVNCAATVAAGTLTGRADFIWSE